MRQVSRQSDAPNAKRAVRRSLRRGGLASLELVLSLPILLFVMGLMILIGTAGGWKLKTQIASREAAFRSVVPRTGSDDGLTRELPGKANMAYTDPNKRLLNTDPFAAFPVVRGPTLSGSNNGGGGGMPIPVNTTMLDMQLGERRGHIDFDRGFPLLGRLPPGRFHLVRETTLMDGTAWQYHTQGYGSNVDRRIPRLYDFQLQTLAAAQVNRFSAIAVAVRDISGQFKIDLSPLEGGDPEIQQIANRTSPDFARAYSMNVNYRQTYDPGYYPAPMMSRPASVAMGAVPEPRVTRTSNLFDPQMVRLQRVEPYKRSVTRTIPRAMSQYYIGEYQRYIQSLQAMMPPPQAVIDDYQTKIDQLRRFVASLPP